MELEYIIAEHLCLLNTIRNTRLVKENPHLELLKGRCCWLTNPDTLFKNLHFQFKIITRSLTDDLQEIIIFLSHEHI